MSKKAKIAKYTLQELLLEREAKCERCGREEWLTLDHIIPIVLLKNFGLSIEEMYSKELLSIYCRPCNALKGNQIDFSDKRAIEILKALIKRFE